MLTSVLRLTAIVVAATAPEPPPGPLGPAHRLVTLAALHERGALPDADFAQAKAVRLGAAGPVGVVVAHGHGGGGGFGGMGLWACNGLPPPPGRDGTQAHVRIARVGGGVPRWHKM